MMVRTEFKQWEWGCSLEKCGNVVKQLKWKKHKGGNKRSIRWGTERPGIK